MVKFEKGKKYYITTPYDGGVSRNRPYLCIGANDKTIKLKDCAFGDVLTGTVRNGYGKQEAVIKKYSYVISATDLV